MSLFGRRPARLPPRAPRGQRFDPEEGGPTGPGDEDVADVLPAHDPSRGGVGEGRYGGISDNFEDVRDAVQFKGIPEAKEKVKIWLMKECGRGNLDNEADFELVLAHRTTEDKDFAGFDLTLRQAADPRNLEKLADEIVDAACRFLSDYRGRQRFALKMEGRPKSITFALHVPARPIDQVDPEGDPFEPVDFAPSQRGIVGMFMQHNHAMMREVITHASGNRTDYQRELRELREENARMRNEIYEGRKIAEELHDMKFRRDLELREYESEGERKDQIIRTLQMAAVGFASHAGVPSGLMNLLSGAGGAGSGAPQLDATTVSAFGATNAFERDVFAVIDYLERNQNKMMELMPIFDQPTMEALLRIYQLVQDRKKQVATHLGSGNSGAGGGAPNGNGGGSPGAPQYDGGFYPR